MAEYIDREVFKKSVEEYYCKPCKADGKDHNFDGMEEPSE